LGCFLEATTSGKKKEGKISAEDVAIVVEDALLLSNLSEKTNR
jgi:hypothetical protein